ncbi:shikimate dehydrogenase [Tomitella fengzijianii]|uniref:shikimate dehydrogenase n=1 Tax=Tomitella fengzijianii TaxID=2597660 RepID=UPI00131B9338|nr:shikimate dehydrogenase [Tomitella fengzijianii]
MDADRPRKAGVLGSPIAHSRSPQLHLAAYRALGLADWTYERIECDADALPGLVGALGPEWVGLSVTMPGKFAALAIAAERTARAELVGAANTLVRIPGGWRADCTDIDGVTAALDELDAPRGAGLADAPPAVILGAGGTARPALVALADRGAGEVTLAVRDTTRAVGAVDCARRAGLDPHVVTLGSAGFAEACAQAPLVISTLPGDAAAAQAGALASARRFLDVAYHPWPTSAARAVLDGGGVVVGGLAMLLGQAYGQVEQFTGKPAPRAAMAAALG